MIATDFYIERQGELVGMMSFEKNDLILPNDPDLLRYFRDREMKGHKIVISISGDKAIVSVDPPNFTRRRMLRSVEVRLSCTEFVLRPIQPFDEFGGSSYSLSKEEERS